MEFVWTFEKLLPLKVDDTVEKPQIGDLLDYAKR